jgi:hypothetical protein
VIRVIPADKFEFLGLSDLLEILTRKFEGRLDGFRSPLYGLTNFRLPGDTSPIFSMKSSKMFVMLLSGGANVILSI